MSSVPRCVPLLAFCSLGLEGMPPAPHVGLRPPITAQPSAFPSARASAPLPRTITTTRIHTWWVHRDLCPVRPGPAHSGCCAQWVHRKQPPSEHSRRQLRPLRPRPPAPGWSTAGPAGPQRAPAACVQAGVNATRPASARVWGGGREPEGSCGQAPTSQPLSRECASGSTPTPLTGPSRGPRVADARVRCLAGPPAAGSWQGTHRQQEVPWDLTRAAGLEPRSSSEPRVPSPPEQTEDRDAGKEAGGGAWGGVTEVWGRWEPRGFGGLWRRV